MSEADDFLFYENKVGASLAVTYPKVKNNAKMRPSTIPALWSSPNAHVGHW